MPLATILRRNAVAFVIALPALLAATPAARAAWSAPVTLPAADGGLVRAVVRHGPSTLVLTTPLRSFDTHAPLVATVVRGGRVARRTVMPDASVRSLAERPDGGVDVLLSSHRDNRAQTQRLAVVRITRDGGARRVWSQRTGTGIARIAAGPSGASAVLWTDAGPRHGGVSQPILRVAVAPRGGRFGPARTLRGVLSAGLLSEGYFFDVGLAVDSRGRLLVALPIWRKAGGILVLASLRGDGALVTRQALPGPEGLVHVATAPSGRAAVLVEETGIEGESGECVSSHVPRQVWAVLRAPGADRFAAPQALERRPLECAAVRAQLVMAATGRAVVLWGTAPETDPPPGPTIRMAEAAPGEPFGTPVTAPFGPMLGSAAFRAGEELTVATLAPSDLLQPYRGPLSVVTRSFDGALGARTAITGGQAWAPVLSAYGRTQLALAWSDGTRVTVRTEG